MEDIIVREQKEVVRIVQLVNVMNLLLTQPPAGVKLIDCQTCFIGESRAKAYANQMLANRFDRKFTHYNE